MKTDKIITLTTQKILFFCSTFLPALSFHSEAVAQKISWKGWASVNVNIPVTAKLDVMLSHLRAYDFASGENDFNQTQLRGAFAITKKARIYAGGLITGVTGSATGDRQRFFVKADYKLLVAKTINCTNGIQGEVNSINESRFRYRIVLQSRLGMKGRLHFANLAPSLSYSLYYNIGGKAIQYFDKTGNRVSKQTPDGFHRGRLYVNLNSKINNRFSITGYIMTQREFNISKNVYRNVNVVNPVNNKIARPFDDFNSAGLILAVSVGKNGGKNALINN